MNEAMPKSLVFVYNADSGLFNTMSDIAHKTFAPETYSCNLCAITYGTFVMRAEWKQFLESLGYGMEFLYRNQLQEHYSITDADLPAVFLKLGGNVEVLITASEINSCKSIEVLRQLILDKLGRAPVEK